MKQFFGNRFVMGITQFIQGEHYGTLDFIDYHCMKMGLSRNEYMAYYGSGAAGVDESIQLNEEEKSTDRGPLDNPDIEKALKTKAKESGIEIGILRAVMRRGMGAWNSSHYEGATQEQWGYARVNSFIEKGSGTWGKADKDLADEVKKK